MLELGSKVLICYLLGSVMGGLVVGRLRGGVDIRQLGSGNVGGTNALRTQGKLFALAVVVIDVGKGWLAAAWIPALELPGVAPEPLLARDWLTVACAAAAVVGHVFPVWFAFRGGKGAATLVGVLAGLAPSLLVPVILAWALALIATGYVGLATMTGALVAPLWLLARPGDDASLLAFALVMAAFLIYTHRSNIRRMLAGTEHRSRRAMLFRRG